MKNKKRVGMLLVMGLGLLMPLSKMAWAVKEHGGAAPAATATKEHGGAAQSSGVSVDTVATLNEAAGVLQSSRPDLAAKLREIAKKSHS